MKSEWQRRSGRKYGWVPRLCAVWAGVALSSCSSDRAGGRTDAGHSFQCTSDADAGAEPLLARVSVDGGVGLDQYVRAIAIARCTYWARCSALAPYVVNECVEALVAHGNWSYTRYCARPSAAPHPAEVTCAAETVSDDGSTTQVQAVQAGTLHYDPQRAGECVAALLAEGCPSDQLIEAIPACTGVFTCAAGTDGGGGTTDGGVADPTSCAGSSDATPLQTCSTAADCVGAVGPYCVAGFCSTAPCELSVQFLPGDGTRHICTAYAQVGQPCLNNATSITTDDVETATETCAPGLSCAGAVDGGAGTCVTPQDVGGGCTSTAGCRPGLACTCGACRIPPSAGSCADGLCKVGVAYCDSNVCKPAIQQGGHCDGALLDECAPGLSCSVISSTCVPPD